MTKSAVAYWVALFNASQATLATRTSERDSARNSLYVSGVYGSGVTWQQQDATDVANYNAMVTDRNTWQSRANSAWGASRVWNSGESWEAAYNRVLPLALSQWSASAVGNIVTAPYTGNYAIRAWSDGHPSFAQPAHVEILVGGVQQAARSIPIVAGDAGRQIEASIVVHVTAGQVISFTGSNYGFAGGSGAQVTFIPTVSEPH